MKNERIIKGLLTLICLLAALFVFSMAVNAEIVASGNCGEINEEEGLNGSLAKWTLDDEGTLRITGKGRIEGSFSDNDPYISEHRQDIKAIVIEEGITAVGSRAFDHCENAETLILPDSLEELGNASFSFCLSLTSVRIPDKITELPMDLFFSDYSIEEVILPKNLKKICWQALLCQHLYSLVIPASVETIEDAAFYAAGLQYIYYEGSEAQWNKIVNYTHNDCLRTAKIFYDYSPDKVYILEEGECGDLGGNLKWKIDTDHVLTVYGTGKMKDYYEEQGYFPCHPWIDSLIYFDVKMIVVEEGVTNITDFAFCGTNATKAVLANSLTDVPSSAFLWNGSIKEINIPDELSESSSGICGELSALETITVSDKCRNYYTDQNGVLFCKNDRELLAVPTVCETVTVPKETKVISIDAFLYAHQLKNITVEEGNPAYCSEKGVLFSSSDDNPKSCLIHCPAKIPLTQYTCPDGTITINHNAFANNQALRKIVIPETVEYIHDSSFQNCLAEEIVLPKSVEYMGNACFQNCPNLRAVELPQGANSLYFMFYNCPALQSVSIPSTVTSIGEVAFAYCPSLKELTIPESVTEIDNQAFICCESLKNINIPNSVTTIGLNLFYGCVSLETAILSDQLKTIPSGTFYGCNSLQEIVIPEGVETIGYSAFFQCSALKRVTISASVSSIEDYCFAFEPCVEAYDVDPDNLYFSSDAQGNLYNKDKTRLIQYAAGSKNALMVVPDSVKELTPYCFCMAGHLKTVVLPANLTTLPSACFFACDNLSSVYIRKGTKKIDQNFIVECGQMKTLYFECSEEEASVMGNVNLQYNSVYQTTQIPETEEELIQKYLIAPGDVDGDGEISAADARLALRASVGLEPEITSGTDAYLAADADGNGEVTSADARLILRASVGLEDAARFGKR